MRRAIVTGGRGFIGRHLVADLRRRGVQVTTIGSSLSQDRQHFALGHGAWNAAQLARILAAEQPDAIFHLAGTAVGTPADLDRVNIGLAMSLMQALGRTGQRPLLVVAGSASEYGAAIALIVLGVYVLLRGFVRSGGGDANRYRGQDETR